MPFDPPPPIPTTSSPALRWRGRSGDFVVTIHPRERIVRVAINGFWDSPTVDCFAEALRDAGARLGTQPGEHLVLADITRSAIQSQVVMNRLTLMVAASPNRARRLALLEIGTGVRLQASRLLGVPEDAAMFVDEVQARAWLMRDPGRVVPLPARATIAQDC